ncbi:Protein of unknown function, partial [Pyronema omphalodes CBS 100304]
MAALSKLAEDEHDVVLVDSLEHEPSPILRALKALSTTFSYIDISTPSNTSSNPPVSQAPRRRPVKFEIGPPSSSSSDTSSSPEHSAPLLTMQQHGRSSDEGTGSSPSSPSINADAPTASPPSPKVRWSFEENTPRLVEDLSPIERSILFAQKTGYLSSSPKTSPEPLVGPLPIPEVGQVGNKQSSTAPAKQFPPSLSSIQRASTNSSTNAESDQPSPTRPPLKRQPPHTPRLANLRSISNPLSAIPTVTTMAPPLNEYEVKAYKISAQAGTNSPPVPITVKVKINPPLYDSWSIDLGMQFPKIQAGKSYFRFGFDPVESVRAYIEVSADHSGCSCGRARLSELAEKRKASQTQENRKPAPTPAPTPAQAPTPALA